MRQQNIYPKTSLNFFFKVLYFGELEYKNAHQTCLTVLLLSTNDDQMLNLTKSSERQNFENVFFLVSKKKTFL
jgi:hypothetical protein